MTKTITILGAGKSSYNLVSYLSKNQERIGIDIKVISNQTPNSTQEFRHTLKSKKKKANKSEKKYSINRPICIGYERTIRRVYSG